VKKYTLVAAIALLALACDKFGGGANLNSDEKKAGYAIGQQIGQSFKMQNVNPDLDSVVAGMKDALKGEKGKLTPEETQAALMKLREASMAKMEDESKKNKEKGDKFLADNKTKEGVKTTESGLQYQVVTEGKGDRPKDESVVKVHYKGTLIDGTEFDSSYTRGEPAEFPVNGVIKGWTEALKLMTPGSKYKLTIPADLAYGPMGRPPTIPGNSVLVFDVELLDIVKAAPGGAAPGKEAKPKVKKM
jgi:FKBP-type peptidyl-prolyl cis-trans isomerase